MFFTVPGYFSIHTCQIPLWYYNNISLLFTMSENATENKNLKRISVSVDEDDYAQLKDLSRAGLSIGFLIREAIHDFLDKTKK